jgi:uncharacterized protein (DUF1778 family)
VERTNRLDIRVTDAEKAMIAHCASRLGMSQTDVIINGIKLINEIIEKRQRGRGQHDQ